MSFLFVVVKKKKDRRGGAVSDQPDSVGQANAVHAKVIDGLVNLEKLVTVAPEGILAAESDFHSLVLDESRERWRLAGGLGETGAARLLRRSPPLARGAEYALDDFAGRFNDSGDALAVRVLAQGLACRHVHGDAVQARVDGGADVAHVAARVCNHLGLEPEVGDGAAVLGSLWVGGGSGGGGVCWRE